MGEAPEMIPLISLSGEVLGLDRESEEWKAVTKKVREACETYGCFVLDYEKLPIEVQEQLFKTTKEMFDLPLETKLQYKRPTLAEGGYVPSNPINPLSERFSIYGGEDELKAFEKLMWPEGKPGFCEILNSAKVKMLELNLLILRMIFESFGLGENFKSKALDEMITGDFGSLKYRVPKEKEVGLGLTTHIDKTIMTTLCQNSVQGLEALTKEGNWITLDMPEGNLFVVVGEVLEAWTNGRLHAVTHRVAMRGDKERYSCGCFSIPKDGVTIEVPEELVDKEHPLLYRPFVYSEYLAKHLTNMSIDALQVYAGI